MTNQEPKPLNTLVLSVALPDDDRRRVSDYTQRCADAINDRDRRIAELEAKNEKITAELFKAQEEKKTIQSQLAAAVKALEEQTEWETEFLKRDEVWEGPRAAGMMIPEDLMDKWNEIRTKRSNLTQAAEAHNERMREEGRQQERERIEKILDRCRMITAPGEPSALIIETAYELDEILNPPEKTVTLNQKDKE